MELYILPEELTVCQLPDLSGLNLSITPCFFSATGDELSLVCPTAQVPAHTTAREDGWRAFRVQGQLDFSLVGILARISGVLAEAGVSIFAVSTYDTDYVLVKADRLAAAVAALQGAGYSISQ